MENIGICLPDDGYLAAVREITERHGTLLIFDEVKYFYPYKDRMAEYTPVQQEVDHRVAAVRKIWDDSLRISTKPDATGA